MPLAAAFERDRHALQSKWAWFAALGAALVLLGAIAIAAPWMTTLGSVVFYGWLLAFSGASETITAFSARPWQGVVLHLIGGLLSLFVGLAIVARPAAGAETLTLLFAIFFLVSGLGRAASAFILRLPGWTWSVGSGLITALLGAMVWRQWPESSSWLIGTYVGVELIARGWPIVLFAFALRPSARTA